MKHNYKLNHILLIIASAVLLITLIVLSAYAQTNTDISFTQQIKMGNLAVADFNTTDGISLYSQNNVRHEKQTPDGTVFTYEGTSSGYPRVSNKDGIFISGTYDNSTIVFYVKETTDAVKSISVKTKNINEASYFAGIESDKITSSSVSMAIYDGDELCWRKIISSNSSDVITTELDYTVCPFDNEKNAYLVALRVDDGMTCFESLQFSGLEIVEMNDCKKTLFYENGVLMQGDPGSDYSQADSTVHFNLDMIKNVTACEINENEASNPVSTLTIFLKNLYDFLVRVVNIILSIFR